MKKDSSLMDNSTIDIGVSYDGSWHRRAHTSHHGVGTIIELETGLVIDTYVMSNYCFVYAKALATSDADYDAGYNNPRTVCQKTFSGSSHAMEVEAAKVMFQRSIELYKFRYTRILCDGDAKAVTSLNNANIYTEPIVKEDYVNNGSKRLHNGTERLKQSSKGSKYHLNRKGCITQKQLSISYYQALKDAVPDVQYMQRAVLAILYHRMSTDTHPQHQYCPEGKGSWFKYQVETSQGVLEKNRQYKHKVSIKPEYGEPLVSLYN